MRLLVTGFGPFLDIDENPSARLAESLGAPYRILPVEFAAIDQWIEGIDPGETDAVLMFGVARNAERIRIERVARNLIGPTPDASGEVRGPAPIEVGGPSQWSATLWPTEMGIDDSEPVENSVDAGDYLCNYALYRLLDRWPAVRAGFVHIPPFERLDYEIQKRLASRILDSVTSIGD